jgi:RNA polymerase sigma factor (sigma-70 family)
MNNELLTTIVQQAKEGDKGALEQLYYETYNRVYFYAFKMFADENDAADVVQEVYIKVFTKISELNDVKAFPQWLYTITVNECRQKMRRDRKQILTDEGDAFFERILDSEPELEQRMVHRDARTYLLAVIDFLPEEQKRAVLLYYYEQLTIRQIAEIEEVPEATVKSRLVLARKKLKAAVEAEERRTGTRLLAAGMPALAAVLAEGALLITMPAELASQALTVALAAIGFIDSPSAVTYISDNESEEEATLKDRLNRGIIVELKPVKIFALLLLLAVLALTGFLMILEKQDTTAVPDNEELAGVENKAEEQSAADETDNELVPQKENGSASSVGSSAADPDILTAGQELKRLPMPEETYWMEITPDETGYYCFEARFGGAFRGDKTEFRTWLDAPSWEGLCFGGANTVCAKWSGEDSGVPEVMHLYFTDDSMLQAGQKYVVSLTFEGDFNPQEIRLIKTDIPFSR